MSWLVIACFKNAILALPLVVAALAVGRWSRRPALAHVLWVLVLVKLITPPLIGIPVGWSVDVQPWLGEQRGANEAALVHPAAVASIPAEAPADVVGHLGGQSSLARERAFAPPRPWFWVAGVGPWLPSLGTLLSLAGVAWLGGCIWTAGLLFWRAWRFDRFLRLAARHDERLASRVRQLSYRAGLVGYPKVIVVEGVVSPMLWGVGRGVQLVFPSALIARLSPAETDALLLHELAHYSRGDYWVRVLELTAHVAYWWNPIVWWACRQIETAEEQCCDAWVVEHQSGTRLSYAEALLATIDFLNEPAALRPPAACGLGEVPLLKLRLTQIMRGELAAQLSRTVWACVLLAGLVLSPLEPAVLATASRRAVAPKLALAEPLPPLARSTGGAEPAASQPPDVAPATQPVASPLTTPVSVQLPALSASLAPPRTYASASSPDGRFKLEARTGRKASLTHIATGWRLDLSNHRFTCASFAPDSRSFVTGHDDGVLRQWDTETGVLLTSLRTSSGAVTSVAHSADGSRFASGSADGVVAVWDASSLAEVARVARPATTVSCVRWSPLGDRLAIGLGHWQSREDARLHIWAPDENVLLSDEPLQQPAGALAWLSEDAVLVASWDGQGYVRSLRGTLPDQHIPLDKELVSAASWSSDVRLVSRWVADKLAAGAGL